MNTKQEVKHTPLPWDRDGFNLSSVIALDSGRRYFRICSCSFDKSIKDTSLQIEDELANAAFIVKCVNSHYELVEALRNVNEFLLELERQGVTMLKISPDLRGKLNQSCIKSEQALAKAEAK